MVYVREKGGLTGTQRAGICVEAAGLILALLGVAGFGAIIILVGVALLLLGLPLLLARKHPWIILGWMAVGLSLVVFNPYTSIASWGLLGGIRHLQTYLTLGERYISYLYAGLICITRGLLVLILLFFTGRAIWTRLKKQGSKQDSA